MGSVTSGAWSGRASGRWKLPRGRQSRTSAPPGRSLVSVNLVGRRQPPDDALRDACVEELVGWYGAEVRDWRPVGTVHLPEALPDQAPDATEPMTRAVRLGPGRFVCGGHRESATLGGALRSGRRAAQAVLAERGGPPGA